VKPTWTVSRLLREYPQCKKVLESYEINAKDVSSLTIQALAEEIEEDLDDFIDQLDSAVNSYSEYDVPDDEEFEGEDDDEYEATEGEEEEEEEVAAVETFDDTPIDGDDDVFGAEDEEEGDAEEGDDEVEDDAPGGNAEGGAAGEDDD
jgi:hypothetical protein